MLGDCHVDDLSTVVREDHEDEEQPERDRRHDEEVGGHDLARVIGQKRAPGLGRWARMPSQVFGRGRLTHRDPQLQELAVNPRGTPQGIRGGHVANERAHVRCQRWAAGAVSACRRSRRGETRGDATRSPSQA
jgi:hypothetical protein